MSLRPASQEQLDFIAATLDLQAAEIAALRERVAVLEAQAFGAAQGSEFELVSAAPLHRRLAAIRCCRSSVSRGEA